MLLFHASFQPYDVVSMEVPRPTVSTTMENHAPPTFDLTNSVLIHLHSHIDNVTMPLMQWQFDTWHHTLNLEFHPLMYGFVCMWIVVMLALDSFDVRVLDSSLRENQGISRREEERDWNV